MAVFRKGKGLSIRPLSLKLVLVAVTLLLCVTPLIIQAIVLKRSFSRSQLEARGIEIANQCAILSSRMTRAGYLSADSEKRASLDGQMQSIADVFNGRIVIVGPTFRIIEDTFNLHTGKYYISEEVIRGFKGEGSLQHNEQMHYYVQTSPVYDSEDEKTVSGVIVFTASTQSLFSVVERVDSSNQLFLGSMIAALAALSVAAAFVLLRPLKRLQLALDRVARGDLEADVMEGTYLETMRLSQAVNKSIAKLQAVDRSREEFVSNVSHELKTPITSIRVLADSLMGMQDAPVELYREFLSDISDEVDRENHIIEDLLMLVKTDRSAEKEMTITQTNINAELEQVLKRLRPIAKRGNIELILESFREVTADVDRLKFSLAVMNLVENAIKYNHDSGWVRVTLDADHKFFYVKVADCGIGIPEEAIEHIFDRFYRVDKARSREVGGTGLGLSIAKNIVNMHHGVIDAESTRGEGTVFHMRIPLHYVQKQEAGT